jgi:hypothetical protein
VLLQTMTLNAPLPEDMDRLLKILRRAKIPTADAPAGGAAVKSDGPFSRPSSTPV